MDRAIDNHEADAPEQSRQLAVEIAEYERVEDLWWECKDGSVILIVEMGDGHLVNTIRMLHRRAKRAHRLPVRLYRSYGPLCAEAVKRGLEEEIFPDGRD